MPKYITIKNYNVRINLSNVSSYFPIDLVPSVKIDDDKKMINPIKDWWLNPQPNKNSDIKEMQYYIGFCFNGDGEYVRKFIFKDKEERDYCMKEMDESVDMCCINVSAEYGLIKKGDKVIVDLWADNFWTTVKYKNEYCINYKSKKIPIIKLQNNSWVSLDAVSDEDSKGFLLIKNKKGDIFEIHKNLLKKLDK